MFQISEILGEFVELSSEQAVVSLANETGLANENEAGDNFVNIRDVLVENPGVEAFTQDELDGMGIGEFEGMSEEDIGDLEVEGEMKDLLKTLRASVKATESKEQSFICPEEGNFDRDYTFSPRIYAACDELDLARVVELQLYITGRQETVDYCQAMLDKFSASPVPRPIFMKWVAAKGHAISQKLQAIKIVQAVAGERGDNYRKAIWYSFFQLDQDNLQEWLSETLEKNTINKNMTRGEVDPELENAVLRSANLDRADELAENHCREEANQAAVISAPLRDWEEPRVCGCVKCEAKKALVVEEDAFNSYIRNMSEEQEAQLHISVYA